MEKDLLSFIWSERKNLPKNKVFLHDEKYSGKSANKKLKNACNHRKNIV